MALGKYFALIRWAVPGMLVFFLIGCVPMMAPPAPDRPVPAPQEPVPDDSDPLGRTPPPVEAPTQKLPPRAVAALTLTEQGRVLIEEKRADDAIRTLERAMNLYPKNGKVYYYLADAWLLKGNVAQAAEFNRLAAIYLQKDHQWGPQVERQRIKIQNR